MKSQDYLKQITARKGKTFTQYGIWAAMKDYGWSESTGRNYKKGNSLPSDSHCLDIADALELDPAVVLADIAAERAMKTDPEAGKVWERIAKTMHNTAAVVTLAVILSGAALSDITESSTAYITGTAGKISIMLSKLVTAITGLEAGADLPDNVMLA